MNNNSKPANPARRVPQTTGPMGPSNGPAYGYPTPSLDERAKDRTWEDMLQDEKIERLMRVVTHLYRRTSQLERENEDLRRHKHDEWGEIYVGRRVGERTEVDEPSSWRDTNPFNSKELEDNGPY